MLALKWLLMILGGRTLRKRRGSGGLRTFFSRKQLRRLLFARQDGGIGRGGGGVGSPPFPAVALASGAATHTGRRPWCSSSRKALR